MGEGLCLSGATVRSVVEQSVSVLYGYKLLKEPAKGALSELDSTGFWEIKYLLKRATVRSFLCDWLQAGNWASSHTFGLEEGCIAEPIVEGNDMACEIRKT